MNPAISLIDVTPELAQQWLLCNANNRPLRQGVAARYARDMTAGRWMLNGDPIRFDGDKQLIDGQHRLTAVVSSNHTIKSVVVRELSNEAFFTIDQPSIRRPRDYFGMAGIVAPNVTESACALIWRYENGRISSNPHQEGPATVGEIREVLTENPEVLDSQHSIRNLRCGILQPKGTFVGCHFLMNKSDPEKAGFFFNHLATGKNLSDGDPIYLLREKLVRNLGSKKKISRKELLALIIKAWNNHKMGAKIKLLKWASNANPPEKFPTIY